MYTRRPRQGATLIEVMVSMVLIAVALLALVSANTLISRSSSNSYRHHVAMRLAQQRVEELLVGEQKQKLPATAERSAAPVPDGTPADCREAFGTTLAELCNGSQPELLGWVDSYGRPCRRTGLPAQGYHPTCHYRRYVRYERLAGSGAQGDTWHLVVAVSHAADGRCRDFNRGDYQCVVTRALLTR